MFNNVYYNKKVLITGNTGFKGSWLSIWLLNIGAEVYGISNNIPTNPSNFEVSNLESKIGHFKQDIRCFEETYTVIKKIEPDFIFHLAAQPIVKESFIDPKTTIETNVIGTTNVLESVRRINSNCTAVIITSDKCYDNIEWVWGYRENDRLGGEDPYSASKGAAELIVKTYAKSFFSQKNSKVKIASARAGNVIGGGDWAQHRIIPDAVRAWDKNEKLNIRNPKATRPWQHVLEPLSGYLLLGQKLCDEPELNGEAFNFGPNAENNFTVQELLETISKFWLTAEWKIENDGVEVKEAGLLKLNCDKALFNIGWRPNLDFSETIKMVAEWYSAFYSDSQTDMSKFSLDQINHYVDSARQKKIIWTC